LDPPQFSAVGDPEFDIEKKKGNVFYQPLKFKESRYPDHHKLCNSYYLIIECGSQEIFKPSINILIKI
jgi:hypothetical protein